MLLDSAFMLLIGMALAGLVRLFLNEENIKRLLHGSPKAAVFKSAAFGVPLPLCSCSVLPVAYQLRQSGVSKGGTVAFLISTPESGVDSIMLTWSLTDPLLTVARPVSAFLTAIVAGLLESNNETASPIEDELDNTGQDCCNTCECSDPVPDDGWIPRLYSSLRFAFTDLIGDLAVYLLVGYILAGLIGALFLGESILLPVWLTAGWGGYAGAVLIGVPLYVCATSSTPLAAALLVAGFTPGAILVFLLVGPATNLASLTVVTRILGRRSTVRYLLSIVVVALLCGIATDKLYELLGMTGVYQTGHERHAVDGLSFVSAVILSGLILFHTAKRWFGRWS